MEWLPGEQPGYQGIQGYPDHWYDANGNIPCLARACLRLFTIDNIDELAEHWSGKHDSTVTALTMAEHHILYTMLVQGQCDLCFRHFSEPRQLFWHEMAEHGSDNLSRLRRSVYLARLTGHISSALPAIFARMVWTIWEIPDVIFAIFRRANNGEIPVDPQPEELAVILSPPESRPGGPTAPVWTLIEVDNFLSHLAPTDAYRQIDPTWDVTWQCLRKWYLDGDI